MLYVSKVVRYQFYKVALILSIITALPTTLSRLEIKTVIFVRPEVLFNTIKLYSSTMIALLSHNIVRKH